MLLDDYRVRLDAFEGPLDLLLFLIRRAEVDIQDIPIATIAEQYLDLLSGLRATAPGRVDIDTAGEFLVMAATLMEIKSRMLMPRAPAPSRDGDRPAPADPRAELVRQLIEYKTYRDAASTLERRAEEWRARFPTSVAGLAEDAARAAQESAQDLDLEDLSLLDLARAFRQIAESVNFDRLGDHQVTYDDTPIEVHAQDILAQLRGEAHSPAEVEFSTLFAGRKRHEALGLFLALLELVRQRRIAVRQERTDGQIYLRPREPEPPAAPPPQDVQP
jgi:segregation and condensation protein A